jgi:hypothetical protein
MVSPFMAIEVYRKVSKKSKSCLIQGQRETKIIITPYKNNDFLTTIKKVYTALFGLYSRLIE